MFGHGYCGQLRESELVCDEIIKLANGDPHLGAQVGGLSPLLAAEWFRLWCIGFMRDPVSFFQQLAVRRQLALDSGYPEQVLWGLCREAELRWALGSSDGTPALAQTAVRIAENLGVGNQIQAALTQCYSLAYDREWQPSLDVAADTLRLIRERGAMRLFEPSFLAHIGAAHLELGNLLAGRTAALEGVTFMREAKCALSPHSYAILARAQLALAEPAADIVATLDEYAALLERTGFHLYEGELHELRARLAAREGHHAEQTAALRRAHDSYTHFGMTVHLARLQRDFGL